MGSVDRHARHIFISYRISFASLFGGAGLEATERLRDQVIGQLMEEVEFQRLDTPEPNDN